MRAIEVVCGEHRALRAVLDTLELVLECQRRDDRLDPELALETLQWFGQYADELHQDREESGLFPHLALRAPARARLVVGEWMRWHAEERTRLAEMRGRIEGAADGDARSRDSFTVSARAYSEIQRHHADFEDARILPLARQVPLPEDDAPILAEYERLERLHLRDGESSPCTRALELATASARLVPRRQATLAPGSPEGSARGSKARGFRRACEGAGPLSGQSQTTHGVVDSPNREPSARR